MDLAARVSDEHYRFRNTSRSSLRPYRPQPYNPAMTVVRLTCWNSGFVPNRLLALLREAGLGLAESHDLATRLADGNEISVCFDDASRAESFTGKVEALGVK